MRTLVRVLLALGAGIMIGSSCRREADPPAPVPVVVTPTPAPDPGAKPKPEVTDDDKLPLPSILDFPPVVNPKAPEVCTDGSCSVTPPARPELGPVKTYVQQSCSGPSSGRWVRGRFGRLWFVQD